MTDKLVSDKIMIASDGITLIQVTNIPEGYDRIKFCFACEYRDG